MIRMKLIHIEYVLIAILTSSCGAKNREAKLTASCMDSIGRYMDVTPSDFQWDENKVAILGRKLFRNFGQYYAFQENDSISFADSNVLPAAFVDRMAKQKQKRKLIEYFDSSCGLLDWADSSAVSVNSNTLMLLPPRVICKHWDYFKSGVLRRSELWNACVIDEHLMEVLPFAYARFSSVGLHEFIESVVARKNLKEENIQKLNAIAVQYSYWQDRKLSFALHNRDSLCEDVDWAIDSAVEHAYNSKRFNLLSLDLNAFGNKSVSGMTYSIIVDHARKISNSNKDVYFDIIHGVFWGMIDDPMLRKVKIDSAITLAQMVRFNNDPDAEIKLISMLNREIRERTDGVNFSLQSLCK